MQSNQLPHKDRFSFISFECMETTVHTPRICFWVQQLGGYIGKVFERKDVSSLQPSESETAELKDHVIIMGFGRVGQTIAQLLSERLIPYVALDVRADRVIAAKNADLPVYFGDAGAPRKIHIQFFLPQFSMC